MCAWLPTATLRLVDVAVMPCPGWAAKSVAGAQGQAAVAGGGHDGLADRVLASDLGGGDEGQQLVGVVAGEGVDVLEGGPAVGDGAGLVQDDGGEPAGGLQSCAVADEDAELGGLAGSDHDGGRGGQAQGAGAGDDEDGDSGADGQHQPVGARAERHPADEGGQGGEQDARARTRRRPGRRVAAWGPGSLGLPRPDG